MDHVPPLVDPGGWGRKPKRVPVALLWIVGIVVGLSVLLLGVALVLINFVIPTRPPHAAKPVEIRHLANGWSECRLPVFPMTLELPAMPYEQPIDRLVRRRTRSDIGANHVILYECASTTLGVSVVGYWQTDAALRASLGDGFRKIALRRMRDEGHEAREMPVPKSPAGTVCFAYRHKDENEDLRCVASYIPFNAGYIVITVTSRWDTYAFQGAATICGSVRLP